MFRFIHCADLHPSSKGLLGSKVVIDQATGLNMRLTDLRMSLAFMLDVAIQRDVLAILVAGDVFDNSSPDSDEINVIETWVMNVTTAGIKIVMISGNHDVSKTGVSASALVSLRDRDDVVVMERPGQTMFTPDGQMLRICGLPYPSKAFLLANEAMAGKPPEEVTRTINYNLKRIIQQFDVVQDDIPTILLAHGSTINCTVGVQPRSLSNDVFIPVDECGLFDAVCLGHIHAPQEVADNARYSGSPLCNDQDERAERKGFNVLEIEAGQAAKWEFIQNPHARRWFTLTVNDMRQMLKEPYGLDKDQPVWRIKDTLPPAEIEQSRDAVARFQKRFPYVQIDIKPITTTRYRDALMAEMTTPEEQLERFLDGREDNDSLNIESIMAKHAGIQDEVSI